MTLLETIKEFWAVLLSIGGGLGALFTWILRVRIGQKKSTRMLYKELETLKQKVILQVSKEIDAATTIAEKNSIIEGFKSHCPECYEDYLKKNTHVIQKGKK